MNGVFQADYEILPLKGKQTIERKLADVETVLFLFTQGKSVM